MDYVKKRFQPDHPFANDALFEHARYKRQRYQRHRHTQSNPLPDSRHLSSCMTVHSENLTAKEFADIAGIKIVEDMDSDVPSLMISTSSILLNDSTIHQSDIWDDCFWQKPGYKQDTQSTWIKKGRFEIPFDHPVSLLETTT
ncbi:hypothetical protein CU098_010691, partial [Rhizopus stolonifer]